MPGWHISFVSTTKLFVKLIEYIRPWIRSCAIAGRCRWMLLAGSSGCDESLTASYATRWHYRSCPSKLSSYIMADRLLNLLSCTVSILVKLCTATRLLSTLKPLRTRVGRKRCFAAVSKCDKQMTAGPLHIPNSMVVRRSSAVAVLAFCF